jgi:glutathione S-transferase
MLAWMNNSVHPTFTHVFRPTNFASSEAAQDDVKALAVTRFREHLERIQAMIGHASPWLLGDKPSFADFYALVFLRWGGFAAIDPASLPAYKGFVDRVAALPAVASAMAREGINLDTYKA